MNWAFHLFPLRGSPSLGEYGCPNPEVPRDLSSLLVYTPPPPYAFYFLLIPSIPRRPARKLSMRSYRHSVCFLLLMDSQTPRVGHAWRPIGRVVHCWSTVYQFGW
ncbi:hypothetical protein AVEN_127329-1 [Araneus ventricosus]|uniref:Uncharacterized protein n=1 Tax=Araneus ventricosus TaxID=182803 RepID=A0A4Y2H9H0_ARAVE|nr:hypothetical protein AVEN_127329-1 [Araneus ventricosus]